MGIWVEFHKRMRPKLEGCLSWLKIIRTIPHLLVFSSLCIKTRWMLQLTGRCRLDIYKNHNEQASESQNGTTNTVLNLDCGTSDSSPNKHYCGSLQEISVFIPINTRHKFICIATLGQKSYLPRSKREDLGK